MSPPCTTYSTLQYANQKHRRACDGEPKEPTEGDPGQGDMARAHDAWISRLVSELVVAGFGSVY